MSILLIFLQVLCVFLQYFIYYSFQYFLLFTFLDFKIYIIGKMETHDFAYWDLPQFHCELVKPISDDAQAAFLKVG